MCGLVGFWGNFDEPLLRRMAGTIAHRGPDGEGVWLAETSAAVSGATGAGGLSAGGGCRVGLGHRRLAILDLTEAAAQPMVSCGGRYQVVFNGEIYNFKELAEDLKVKGYVFNEHSDTAVLAPLYDAYGVEMLSKLSGIFAFALYDTREQTLFLARDHVGTKPLYYTYVPGEGLLFGSELKALLAHGGVSRDLDEQALLSYLTYLWSPGEQTLLKAVRKLPPGHFMQFWLTDRGVSEPAPQRWYTPPLPALDAGGKPVYDASKTPEDLLHLMDEVVRSQLIADVPVGAFLSGGVDSSAIVSSICTVDSRPLEAFCMRFEGEGQMVDEGFSEDAVYARQVARRYGVQLHEVTVGADCLVGLPDMVRFLDEPQADPAPLYVRQISKAARDRGIKVMLSGTGGDDVFTGYRRHEMTLYLSMLQYIPHVLRDVMGRGGERLAAGLGLGAPMGRRLHKAAGLLRTDLQESLLDAFRYTDGDTLAALRPQDGGDWAHSPWLRGALERSAGQHPVNRQLFLEMHGFLPDHNLNYTDKLSMAEGIEVRVPFLDPKILDFAADLPLSAKIGPKETKRILKKAYEPRLPHEVLYRSKAGFGAPLRRWLSHEARDMTEDLLFSPKTLGRGLFSEQAVRTLQADTLSGKADGTYTLFSLMVVELWCRAFLDGGDAA